MRLRRFIRNLLIFLLVVSIFGAVGYYIYQGDRNQRIARYYGSVTQAVSTAIREALYNATRTLEADQPHYILLKVGPNDALLAVAKQYHTTIDALRMANGLLPEVEFGDGSEIIIPRGVAYLVPPRRFKRPYVAQTGDVLAVLAARNGISTDIIALDNPILARRGLTPGDIVYIAELL